MEQVRAFFVQIAATLPEHSMWVSVLILAILGGTAAYDAWTGRIPDQAIFGGIIVSLLWNGFERGWEHAAHMLAVGLVFGFAIYALNQLYFLISRRDAIGMGDAKWSALAAMNFGWKIVAMAWVVGAWLGLAYLAMVTLFLKMRKKGQKLSYIHFAPFLFTGLLVVLWGHVLF